MLEFVGGYQEVLFKILPKWTVQMYGILLDEHSRAAKGVDNWLKAIACALHACRTLR
jgi:hypothetical protein